MEELTSKENNKNVLRAFVKKHSWLVAFFGSSFITLLMICLSMVRWEGSDDYTVSQILMGASGHSSSFVITIHVIWGKIICILQRLIPFLNWLAFLELLSVWLTFAIFLRIVYRHVKGSIHVILISTFLLSFEVQFLMTLTYTRSAFLLSFAGVIWATEKYLDSIETEEGEFKINRQIVMQYVVAFVLFGFGCLFRNKCGFVSIAFGGILALFPTIRKLKPGKLKEKEFIKRVSVYAAVLVGFILISVVLTFINTLLYKKGASIREYVTYNKARADAYDYSPAAFAGEWKNADVGFSENDYKMMKYIISDDDAFDIAFYNRVQSALGMLKQSGNSQRINQDMIKQWTTLYRQGRYSNSQSAYKVLLALFILALLLVEMKYYGETLTCIGGTFFTILFFINLGRFPPWVADSVFFEASFIFAYVIARSKPRIKYSKQRVLGLALISFCIYACISPIFSKEKGAVLRASDDVKAFLQYVESSNELYLIDASIEPYKFIDAHSPLYGFRRGEAKNLMRVGNWDIKHPVREQQKADWGISSLIYSLIEGKSRLIAPRSSSLETYRVFFAEHYNVSIRISREKVFGDYGIYKFFDKNNYPLNRFVHNELVVEDVFGFSVCAGGTVSGPYEYLEKGDYRIILSGENLDKGHFEVYSSTDGDAIQYTLVEVSTYQVVIDLHASRDINSIEYLTFNRDETCVVRLGNVEVEKVR